MPLLAQDDFVAGLGPIWRSEDTHGVTVVGGRARLECGDLEHFSVLPTERLYPVGDTTFTIPLPTAPDVGAGTTLAIFEVNIGDGESLSIYVGGEALNFQMVHGHTVDESTIAYNPVEHLWWQIRVVGGGEPMVHWETSPDGEAWTARRSKAPSVDISEIAEVQLQCGHFGAESGLAPDYCEVDSFSIVGPLFAPVAVTGDVDGAPLCRSAKLTGTVDPNLSPTSYYFELGTDTGYGRQVPVVPIEIGAGRDPVAVSKHVTGLGPGTTYHYRLVAISDGGTDEGDDESFTTSPGVRVGDRITDPVIRHRVFTGATLGDFAALEERTERDGEPAPAITEVPDPAGGDRTVLKYTVADDDVAPITPTENPRAQALSDDLIRPGDVFESSFEFWLPDDFPDNTPSVGEENGFLTLFSHFYGPPFGASSPFGISVEGFPVATLHWQRNGTYGFDIPWDVPMVKEQWIRIKSRFRFAVDGWVEMWVDDEPITFFAPGTSYNPNDEETTTRLEMQTRDSSNNGDTPNHATISNYRRAGMFEVVTMYHGPLILVRISPAAVVMA